MDNEDNPTLGNEKENEVLAALDALLHTLIKNKPNDRSDRDKAYAVAITDTQKVYAWFAVYGYTE
jgi:hypothetical protein